MKIIASRILLFPFLFLTTSVFAGINGLVAFGVNRNLSPVVSIDSLSGNICDVTSDTTGIFYVTFCSEEPDEYYQIAETKDTGPINREIRSRSVSGFTLYIKENGVGADPDALCIVTISRVDDPIP